MYTFQYIQSYCRPTIKWADLEILVFGEISSPPEFNFNFYKLIYHRKHKIIHSLYIYMCNIQSIVAVSIEITLVTGDKLYIRFFTCSFVYVVFFRKSYLLTSRDDRVGFDWFIKTIRNTFTFIVGVWWLCRRNFSRTDVILSVSVLPHTFSCIL